MHQHKLDDDGLASSYLMLTALILPTLYVVYSLVKKTKTFTCRCKNCLQKKKEPKTGKIISLWVLVLIIAVLLRNIFTIKVKTAKLSFDPYSVLNITVENTQAEVRKAYKKLLRSFSKKLNSNKTKGMAEEAIKNLNKAYEILKDPKSLDNFLNNTSSSELLIALPSFILGFSTPFLVFYIALIALAVPLFFLYKHRNFKKLSVDGSEYASNEHFLDEVENLSDIPSIILQQLFLLVGESQEYVNRNWNEQIPNKSDLSENDLGVPLVSDSKGYLRLILYLTRKLHNSEDRSFIVLSTLNLIESFKKIALEKNKPKVIESLILFEKLVMQGIASPDAYLAQYPGISYETALKNVTEVENRSLESDELILSKILANRELENSLSVLKAIPTVTVQDLKAFTYQTQDLEEAVKTNFISAKTPESISKDGEFFVIPKDSAPNVSFYIFAQNNSPICHVPFTSKPIPNKWYIFSTVNDSLVGGLITLDQFTGKKTVQFSLPYCTSKHRVKVHIMSNGYFGNDLVQTLNIKYV